MRLARASATVAAARGAVDEGKSVDLESLEADVDATCRAIMALPSDEGRGLQPEMVTLSDDLNLLAGALEHEYRAMKQALGELSDRKRAQTAYLKTQKDD
jgi:hypothetical protein